MDVRLKSAQDTSLRLEPENERLKKLNKVQQQAMVVLSAADAKKGGRWW